MWFFLIKSILGAIIGQSTNAWFKKTKMGIWFYKKVDTCYNWAAKRYDLNVLSKEEKLIKRFPSLMKKINKLEDNQAKLKLELIKIKDKKQEKIMAKKKKKKIVKKKKKTKKKKKRQCLRNLNYQK